MATALVSHTFRCAACGEESTIRFRMYARQEPLKVNPPHDWREIDGELYCPKHKVVVIVDGDVKGAK